LRLVFIQATASTDSTITLSPAKAKELNFKEGDVIMVIGRRRRATYARVHVHKGKTSTCVVSANLAMNLRLRNGDKVKVASLTSDEDEEHKTGDMILFQSSPKQVTSVTFSPVEDSLASLESSEGGDEISDDEIMKRFVNPYLNLDNGTALIKKGHILKMTDDNGKNLEFIVTHVELEGTTPEDELEEGNLYARFKR
jgi:translation initiation factor IF-1